MTTLKTLAAALFALALIGLALAGCANTSIVNQWQSPSAAGPPLKRLLVVALAKTDVNRRIFEDEMVRQLKARGVDAVQSYTLAPEQGEIPRARLEQIVATARAEGVLTTRLVRVNTTTNVVPMGPLVYPGGVGFYGMYGGAWGGLYGGLYDPPMVVQSNDFYLETRLFRGSTGDLVWAATTDTFAPGNVQSLANDVCAVVAKALASQALI